MKKLILILLAIFMLASCKTEKIQINYDDSKLQGYLKINNIDIKEQKDIIHFDIELETENNWMASVGGEGDTVISQLFNLENGNGTCSFDIPNDKWPDETKLFFNVFEDGNNFFELTINKNNLKALKSFTYASSVEKKKTSVKFFDDNLKSSLSIDDLTAIDNNDSYKFHLEVSGQKNLNVYAFDNPNGDLFKKDFGTIDANNGLIEFDIKKDILSSIEEFELLIGDDENNIIIIFDPKNINEIDHLTYSNSDNSILSIANIDTSNYSGSFFVNSLICEKQDDYYVYTINTTSDEDLRVMAFNPPDGDIYMNELGFTKGNDTFVFRIDKETSSKIDEFCISFDSTTFGNAFVSFWTNNTYQ